MRFHLFKHSLLLISALLLSIVSQAQSSESEAVNFLIIEEKPIYEGCEKYESQEEQYECLNERIKNHVIKHFKYPKKAKKKGIQGRVFVEFIIGEDGVVRDIKVVKSVHPTLDKEAVRIVQKLGNFTPGRQKGEPIAVSFTIPLNFVLQQP